jgi:hypothetical protein
LYYPDCGVTTMNTTTGRGGGSNSEDIELKQEDNELHAADDELQHSKDECRKKLAMLHRE